MTKLPLLTAKEAAQLLGISLPTLYAYVSRGQLRSEPAAGTREKRYRAEDVARLRERKAGGRGAASVAHQALHFGAPVLESALTHIADGRLGYRGRDATGLARGETLEVVARLLWQTARDPFGPDNLPPLTTATRRGWLAVATLPPIDRCLALLPQIAAHDHRAWSGEADALPQAGARLVRLLASAVAARPPDALPVHAQLAEAWRLPAREAEIIRAALVLCADHELNASAFAVRVATSTGATVYGAAIAGLATLQGPRHGGMTRRVRAMFDDLAAADDLAGALALRIESGADVPGFGHPLYPDGDPRGRVLLEMLADARPDDPAMRFVADLLAAAREVVGRPPTIDVALAAIERVLKLPTDGALGLFLVGRSVGWVAHAREQAADSHLIRPRARYVGPMMEA